MMTTSSRVGLEALLEALGVAAPVPDFAQSDILNRPIDIYRSYLADTASKALGCEGTLAYEAVQSANIKDNSDLTLILPKLKWRSDKPKELAQEAFIKVTSIPCIDDRLYQYGRCRLPDDQSIPISSRKVVVELSSPNLAREFSSNHLRSTVLGTQVANVYESAGWDVVRMNYLGDWGKDVGLLGVGWREFGSETSFQEDPMTHLCDIFEKTSEMFAPEKDASRKARDDGRNTAEIEGQGVFLERDLFFKRLEDGEPEEVGFWKRARDAAITYYMREYDRLRVKFDEYSGESQVSSESIAEVESTLKEKGIYEESDGSWIIDYSKHGPKSLGVSVLRGRTGSTSYLLRDIAAVLDRNEKHAFDKMLYVVSAEQDVHLQKVFQALRYMGKDKLVAKLEHVSFGKVQGLSEQLGETHLLGDILDRSVKVARDVLEQDYTDYPEIDNVDNSAEVLAFSALIGGLCGSAKRTSSFTFNSKTTVSFDGETGPNLQLCYAKLCTKIKKSDSEEAVLSNVDYTYLQEDPWTEVIRIMAQYPDVTEAAYKSHEPSMVMTYLFHLNEEVSSCLEDDDEDDETGNGEPGEEPPEAILAQTVLFKCARQVLQNGMNILGMAPMLS
ncbi:arginyl-tRNA synthetase [Hypoxylon sp. FL1284]|nr:arginyl-tRNA synthetase [Hypoxylon sp. FL1284]